jgi:hypothetical protein
MKNSVKALGWVSIVMLAAGLGMEIYDQPEFWKPAGLGCLIGYIIAQLIAVKRSGSSKS